MPEKINRKAFYDYIRPRLFGGRLSQGQVNGCEAILDEWEHRKLLDKRHLGCMLGTAYLETDKTIQPIQEYGRGWGRPYGIPSPRTGKTYYGRGLVQLTWEDNYEKMGKILGIDLLYFPELALRMDIAVLIMFEGMLRADTGVGDFTGVALEDFLNDVKEDWPNSRKVINGNDRKFEYAHYAQTFHTGLLQGNGDGQMVLV